MGFPWGIDFGNANCVMAVARRGGIDTICNEASQRQTACMVSFVDRERFLGEGARTKAQTNVKNTVTDIKRLIGRRWDDPELQEELKYFPFTVGPADDGGIVVQVTYNGERRSFTPVQVLGMLLSNFKNNADREVGGSNPDVVISVPAYYTDAQRRQMLHAADIAGLKVLRLINETCAAALAYGLPKSSEFPDDSAKPTTVVFFDLGQSACSASAVQFNKSKLKVIGTAFNRNLGGRNFDDLLVKKLVEEFKVKFKIDCTTEEKAMFRLRTAAAKTRESVSGVPKMMMSLDCLIGEKDVQATIERDEFEAAAAPLVAQAVAVLQELFAQCSLKVEDVESIQLVGSVTRMPSLCRAIKDFFGGREPGRALNSEECIAKGCALAAAIISPTFKVRDFAVVDSYVFPVNLSWATHGAAVDADAMDTGAADAAAEKKGDGDIFKQYGPLPVTYKLSFNRSQPFDINAAYGEGAPLPVAASKSIGKFHISGLPTTASGGPVVVKVLARLDLHGTVHIDTAQAFEDYEEEVEEAIPVPAAPAAPAPAAPAPAPAAASTETPAGDASATPAADAAAEPAAAPVPAVEVPAVPLTRKVIKKRQRKTDCKVTEIVEGTVADAVMAEYRQQEASMAAQDRLIKETADRKNELESYVYAMRDKIGEGAELGPFISSEDRATFGKMLEEIEEWLYSEEADEGTKVVFCNKLDQLKTHGSPLEARAHEASARPEAAASFRAALEEYRSFVSSVNRGDEKYAHITPEQAEKVSSNCNEAETWLEDKLNAQKDLALYQDPIVKAHEIKSKMTALQVQCRPIVNTPKPAPPKEEKPAAAPAPAAAEGEPAAAADGAAPAGPTPSVDMELD